MDDDGVTTGELIADAIIAAARECGVVVDAQEPGEFYGELLALGSWVEGYARHGGDVEGVRRARRALESYVTGRGARYPIAAKRAIVVATVAQLRAEDDEDRVMRGLGMLSHIDYAFRMAWVTSPVDEVYEEMMDRRAKRSGTKPLGEELLPPGKPLPPWESLGPMLEPAAVSAIIDALRDQKLGDVGAAVRVCITLGALGESDPDDPASWGDHVRGATHKWRESLKRRRMHK